MTELVNELLAAIKAEFPDIGEFEYVGMERVLLQPEFSGFYLWLPIREDGTECIYFIREMDESGNGEASIQCTTAEDVMKSVREYVTGSSDSDSD